MKNSVFITGTILLIKLHRNFNFYIMRRNINVKIKEKNF